MLFLCPYRAFSSPCEGRKVTSCEVVYDAVFA